MASNNSTQPSSDETRRGTTQVDFGTRGNQQGKESNQRSEGNDALPSISLPKGGGAIRDIGEKFDVNAPTGTGSMTIPIALSPSRGKVQPELQLTYSSGNGNGIFGLGWSLSAPSISRKTDKGLPQYRDKGGDAESDVFLMGGEDLVPVFKRDASGGTALDSLGQPLIDDQRLSDFTLRTYQPRVETDFHRIQRWTHSTDATQTHWRTTSRDNITSIYGRDDNSRVTSPDSLGKLVFRWLISEMYDVDGNAIIFIYKAEDSSNIPQSLHEQNREPSVRSTNRYPKTIKYGNLSQNRDPITWLATSAFKLPINAWTFSVVFDYGEHDASNPSSLETALWPCRQDPFSTFRSGFEIRTYRLCRRILLFHHFTELSPADYLVKSTDFAFDENRFSSFLTRVTQIGYVYDSKQSQYVSKPIPPLEFSYSRFPSDEELSQLHAQDIDDESLRNLPNGIDGSIYQLMDLDGEGLSGVFVEQSEGWYYKQNLSMFDTDDKIVPRFGLAEPLSLKPPGTVKKDEFRFLSLAGDGRLDVVSTGQGSWGYYLRDGENGWDTYRSLPSFPNVDFKNPLVKLIDITGDGLTDIAVSEDQVFTYYTSLGYDGYAPGVAVPKAFSEESGARVIFADLEQSIYLADMSGDGLMDLLRVRNGDVCYWPNLGYGQFGAIVRMDNAPWFENVDLYNQANIRVADIDGSATSDILYIGPNGIDIYLNQSGNAFADRKRFAVFPPSENMSTVITADLMGTGTTCIVWSTSLPGRARQPMKYLNITQGVKPNLLIKSVNNLGAETRIHYRPSTTFYQADKLAGKPWITKLPFPVHCVKKVEIFDYVSRHYFTRTFAYHHGYFDGFEREFRGFSLVEEWDAEDFDVSSNSLSALSNGATNLDSTWTTPPTYTKSWFHTGVFIHSQNISQQVAHDYFGAPPVTDTPGFTKFLATLLDDTLLPPGLSGGSTREACRALKGKALRTEVYSADKGPKSFMPYTVSESNYTIETLQGHQDSHLHSTFTVHPREVITYQFERNIEDPRISHDMTLQVDPYGNVLKMVKIAYGRTAGVGSLVGVDQTIQGFSILVYNETDVTNTVINGDNYLLPHSSETRSYQLYGLGVQNGTRVFHFNDFAKDNLALILSLQEIPYEAIPSAGLQKRLLSRNRILYRSNDLSRLLPVGQIESLRLPGESYQQSLTSGLINNTYQRPRSDGSIESLITNPAEKFGGKGGDQGGYVDLDSNGNWWMPSGRSFFNKDAAATTQQELVEAKAHFFRERRFTDPYGHTTLFDYDSYDLLLVQVTDALNNVTKGQNDYRALQPDLITDPNGNRTQCAFDEIGHLVGKAVMGKTTENVGDNLDEFQSHISKDQLAEFVANPKGPMAATLLGHATTRIIENMSRFWLEPDITKKLPACIFSLSRETHVTEPSQGPLKMQVSLSYYDGFGREIQRKIQAEPGPVIDGGPVVSSRWVGSGWKIFNNKGKPVKEFEPFFDDTPEFSFDFRKGVSLTLFYDPLDRVVGTLHPNHTWSKTVFGPWQHDVFDENDTVLLDAKTDPDVGQFFQLLANTEYQPSWYDARIAGGKGVEEKSAAAKAAIHSNTPTVLRLDSLNRPFLTIVNNGPGEIYSTRSILDITDHALSTTDAMGRVTERNTYDMLGHRIYRSTMDAGKKWSSFDVSHKSIYEWDSRGQRFRQVYDALRRDIESNLQPSTGPEIKILMKTYGESQVDGNVHNRRGKIFQVFDQGGVETCLDYDFKGNLIVSQRQFAQEYKTNINWTSAAGLEALVFSFGTQYDALGRVIKLTSPDNTVTLRIFNDGNQLEEVKSNISGEQATRQPIWTTFISNIDYDAKGQRTLIQYGNNTSTKFSYYPDTFRLYQLQTQRRSDTLQSLNYFYDPIGNITGIRDNAQQTIYFRNQIVDPSNDYTYDPSYRLIRASGREHLGQINGEISGPTAPSPMDKFHTGLNQPSNVNAMGTYTETYEFDSVGNLLRLKHAGSDSSKPGWTRTYTYNEKSQIESLTFGNRLSSTAIGGISTAYSYDAHGNMALPHLSVMTWDYSDQLHATAIQNVNNGGVPETTWYVYDSNGNRIRKVTERFAAAGATPARLKDRFYLENYEVYLEYNGGGTTVTLQRDTLHIMDDKARVALVDSRKLGDEPGTPQKLFRYQLGNLLGSVSLELDDQAQIVSYEEYTAFGSTSYQAVRSQRETPKRYAYTGKEHDEENGLHYYGARYYACWLGRWASTDPAVFHPVNSNTHANSSAKTPDHHHCCCSPYVYVDNRPTIAVDPDGRDAVYITYPEYRAKVSLNKIGINASIHVPSGHAGILLIDNKTGTTKYYEYGRYDKAERGLVHKNAHPLPSVKIGPDGHATDASLVPVLAQLSRDHGDGGRIEAAYIQSDKFKEMNDYANKKFLENDDSHRKDYSVYTHNCATFASDVVQQDESVSKPTIIIPTPVNAVDEYQEEGNRKIEYPPPPAAAAPGIPGAPKKEADPKSKPKGGDAKPKPGPKTTPGGKKPQAPPLSTTKKQNATPDSRQVKGRVVN